jgi:hypothetical protein
VLAAYDHRWHVAVLCAMHAYSYGESYQGRTPLVVLTYGALLVLTTCTSSYSSYSFKAVARAQL